MKGTRKHLIESGHDKHSIDYITDQNSEKPPLVVGIRREKAVAKIQTLRKDW